MKRNLLLEADSKRNKRVRQFQSFSKNAQCHRAPQNAAIRGDPVGDQSHTTIICRVNKNERKVRENQTKHYASRADENKHLLAPLGKDVADFHVLPGELCFKFTKASRSRQTSQLQSETYVFTSSNAIEKGVGIEPVGVSKLFKEGSEGQYAEDSVAIIKHGMYCMCFLLDADLLNDCIFVFFKK
jgi:hypothetical protein